MKHIDISIFELLKTGPGPSSSHTIGPMAAALLFRKEIERLKTGLLKRADSIGIELLGSLSATGAGHGTTKAVLAGLMGIKPEEATPEAMARVPGEPGLKVPVSSMHPGLKAGLGDILMGPVRHDHPHSNTMIIRLKASEEVLFERIYYSVGGGFVEWEGMAVKEKGAPVHPFSNMAELLIRAEEAGGLDRVIMENEQAITGFGADKITRGLDRLLDTMHRSVERGLAGTGLLPGGLKVPRKAAMVLEAGLRQAQHAPRLMGRLNAYALAAAEENAAGTLMVTAPTLGSAGVLPGVLHYLRHHHNVGRDRLRKALLAACAVGFVVKANASVAGAEVGCQGEIGVASAMAAAAWAKVRGYGPLVAAQAAAIALEHHLGMTCDPVGGYVQIPCIERNAMGAVKAMNACFLAGFYRPGVQKITFDQVVEAMLETGRDMSYKYKETSTGGLALSKINC